MEIYSVFYKVDGMYFEIESVHVGVCADGRRSVVYVEAEDGTDARQKADEILQWRDGQPMSNKERDSEN